MKYIVDIHGEIEGDYEIIGKYEERLPERLTDDDFETIRIHLNSYKEKLCNQKRWKEAEEYQRIIDRFMAFASTQPETNCSEIPNNSDTISRQSAIDAVLNNEHSTDITLMGDAFGKGYTEGYKEEQNNVLQYLADLPSVPRKGKWIDYSDEGYVECPFCHSATNCDGNKDELHYCFSCGAELRGDSE